MKASTLLNFVRHALFVSLLIGLWEWGARTGFIDQSFVGSPLGIATFTVNNVSDLRLWGDLGWTMFSVLVSFSIGASAAIATGLAFVTWPKLESFCEPYVNALNVLPRIAPRALVYFVVWVGCGLKNRNGLCHSRSSLCCLAPLQVCVV